MPPRFVDRPIQAMSMNIFRLCGDMSHVFSIIVLLLRLRVAKNASGELKEWIRRRWLCSFASLFFLLLLRWIRLHMAVDHCTRDRLARCALLNGEALELALFRSARPKKKAEAVWFATALSVDFRPGILYCKCEIFVFEGPEKAYWFHTCFSSSYVHVLCSLSARHLVRSRSDRYLVAFGSLCGCGGRAFGAFDVVVHAYLGAQVSLSEHTSCSLWSS